MFRISILKTIRDLSLNKTRTLLVLFSMILGITGVGSILDARTILSREMDANYLKTNPAAATLVIDGLNEDILGKVTAMPEVSSIEERRSVTGHVRTEDGVGSEIILYVIKDFSSIKNSIFYPEQGAWPAKTGEILIERVAMDQIKSKIGDTISVKIPGFENTDLKLAGTVHAPALAPAWMEDTAYGFVSFETYQRMGGKDGLNELKFTVSENAMDKQYIQAVAYKIKSNLEKENVKVSRVEIPKPGKHPHATQMETLLFLLEAFGILTFILSAFIVTNMISAILSQQIRQIGMMKAVGAKNSQIAAIYLTVVIVLSVIAFTVSIPFAGVAGRAYAAFSSTILNFEIFDSSVPLGIYLLQIAISLSLPLLAAVYSVTKGSIVTVRVALQDYGVSNEKTGSDDREGFLSGIKWLSRPFIISIRNTFRKRGRLLFTLAVLSIGGALFITAMNVFASMNSTATEVINSFLYDASFRISGYQDADQLVKSVQSIPGVKAVEIFDGSRASVAHPDGTTSNSFTVMAIPSDTQMIASIKTAEGRWLNNIDTDSIVINHMILTLEPGLKVGDTIKLRIKGKDSQWKIAGIVTEIMSEPKVYVSQSQLKKIDGGTFQNVLVTVNDNEKKNLDPVVKQIQKNIEANGRDIMIIKMLSNVRGMIEGHLYLLSAMLIVMSILGVIVGGLGLSTTMSINVLERTRELSVMRAIGASTESIFRIILGEGSIIGLFSWFFAVLLALPLSYFISYNFGAIFFEAPLKSAVSVLGIVLWLVLAVVFAALSCLYPASKASKISVREGLAYE
ncbi:MAG: ABC transporter permease [Clostridia bacterium]|nr:ABC transporter permease [Clostridia bacterium]